MIEDFNDTALFSDTLIFKKVRKSLVVDVWIFIMFCSRLEGHCC